MSEAYDTEDPDYIAWLEAAIKSCDCCYWCNQDIPCAGVQQGGHCDQMCSCDSISDEGDFDLDDDED